jgi:hypothetical protein
MGCKTLLRLKLLFRNGLNSPLQLVFFGRESSVPACDSLFFNPQKLEIAEITDQQDRRRHRRTGYEENNVIHETSPIDEPLLRIAILDVVMASLATFLTHEWPKEGLLSALATYTAVRTSARRFRIESRTKKKPVTLVFRMLIEYAQLLPQLQNAHCIFLSRCEFRMNVTLEYARMALKMIPKSMRDLLTFSSSFN